MPAFVTINRVLLVLLGVMTGLTKVVFMDAEMAIFRNAGVPDAGTVAFGVVQIAAALACPEPRGPHGRRVAARRHVRCCDRGAVRQRTLHVRTLLAPLPGFRAL
jgi:hypothetical protein